jgi:hypothetical protein
MTPRRYVDIPRPYELSPGRFQVDLVFPASAAKRVRQQHAVAWELARIYDVDATTPITETHSPRWPVDEETGGSRALPGRPDFRRLQVRGKPRTLARYLAALRRVLTAVERLATRAARAFGSWRRSLLTVLSGKLEHETYATLRVRAAGFRAQAMTTLIGYLARGPQQVPRRDPSRPMWEQPDAVAYEVWEHVGGVDPWTVTQDEIDAELLRMLRSDLCVVEEAQESVDESQVAMPDTVEELLELSGPAERAPIEGADPGHVHAASHTAAVQVPARPDGPAERVRPGRPPLLRHDRSPLAAPGSVPYAVRTQTCRRDDVAPRGATVTGQHRSPRSRFTMNL